MSDNNAKFIYLAMFFIGILITVIFITNNARRTKRIRELHSNLEDRVTSLTEGIGNVEESISGVTERITDSLERFDTIEGSVESRDSDIKRVIDEADAALRLIREIRERSSD